MKKHTCLSLCMIVYALVVVQGCKDGNVVNVDDIPHFYEVNRAECLRKFAPFIGNTTQKQFFFKIVHISDVHVSSWSSNCPANQPYNLEEAVRFANDPAAGFHTLIETGDHINNKLETQRDEALKYLDAFANALYSPSNLIPTFTSTGNHDANMLNPDHPEYALSKADIYNHITSRTNYAIHTDGVQNYYYADLPNPAGGVIRIISLDVIDQDGVEFDAQHFALFTAQQVNWFCETALKENMTENHSVIVLIHYPLPSNAPAAKDFVFNDFQYHWLLVPEIIEAFRSKSDFTHKYICNFRAKRINPVAQKMTKRNVVELEPDTLSVNVSFRDAPGEFICYLGGHAHTYLHYGVDDIRNKNPDLPKQIMILANNMSPSERNAKSPVQREINGVMNNTFNVYAIDTVNKTIHITFFGATGFYYPEIIALKYL